MLTHPTLDQLNQLGLLGMAKAFGEAETSAGRRRRSPIWNSWLSCSTEPRSSSKSSCSSAGAACSPISPSCCSTSLYFHGAGGESLGRHGKSKDHRPDLRQVIVGVVLDTEGRPICSEAWPGNATDVKSLLP